MRSMFRRRQFRGMKYTNTMIAGVKSASGKRVAHVYVTYLSELIIYPLEHRREAHTLIYQYFMDAGVPEYLYSDNS